MGFSMTWLKMSDIGTLVDSARRTILVVEGWCIMDKSMQSGLLRAAAVLAFAVSFSHDASAAHRARHIGHVSHSHVSHVDPGAPYKVDRTVSSPGSPPIINRPGQQTVLTRQILDDKNPVSLRDALRTTAGVSIGR